MSNNFALPTKPLENWQQIRDEWISAVEQLVEDAENWSQKQSMS